MPDLGRAVTVNGLFDAIQGNWILGSLLAFQSYLGYVFGPASSLANANIQLQSALASLKRVSALYDIVPEESGTGREADCVKGEVEFRQVSFSYNSREQVLQGISFPRQAWRAYRHCWTQRRRQNHLDQPVNAFLQADQWRNPDGRATGG